MAGVHARLVAGIVVRTSLSTSPEVTFVFLGEDLLPYLVLALGGAMLVGNALAVVRPPAHRREGELDRAPTGRSLAMAGVGLVAAVWALASLLTG